MDRRDLLKSAVAGLAIPGLTVEEMAVSEHQRPLLLKVTCSQMLTAPQRKQLKRAFQEVSEELEPIVGYRLPVVVVPSGFVLKIETDEEQHNGPTRLIQRRFRVYAGGR